jgi:hypothetical protein
LRETSEDVDIDDVYRENKNAGEEEDTLDAEDTQDEEAFVEDHDLEYEAVR